MPKVQRRIGSLMGLPELAERFGLSLPSIESLYQRNKLPPEIEVVRLGGRVLFRRSDVDKFLRETGR